MSKRSRAPMVSADSELKSKLAKATSASGLTEMQLLQALSTSLPMDEIQDAASLTSTHSVLEVGESLYLKLTREKSQRGFYDRLTQDQQAMLIVYLVHAGFAPATVAIQLMLSEDFVLKTWDNYADKLGQHVTGVRLDTVVGNLKAKADFLYQNAVRAGNYSLAWKITKDLLECLQELNIVARAVHKQEVTHKYELSETQMQELDEMLALRKKRDEAAQRLKVEVTTDPIPQLAGEAEPEREEEESE